MSQGRGTRGLADATLGNGSCLDDLAESGQLRS
jgi:hypothetical protein